MKIVDKNICAFISGGEIIPGIPSPDTFCDNVQLMVLSGLDQPGFDVGGAVQALLIACPLLFPDEATAREYALNGGIPAPSIL